MFPQHIKTRSPGALQKKKDLDGHNSSLVQSKNFRMVIANENAEDIGARRLHAIFEQLLEDVLFNAGDENMPPFELKIDEAYVNERLKGENRPMDIRKFIL